MSEIILTGHKTQRKKTKQKKKGSFPLWLLPYMIRISFELQHNKTNKMTCVSRLSSLGICVGTQWVAKNPFFFHADSLSVESPGIHGQCESMDSVDFYHGISGQSGQCPGTLWKKSSESRDKAQGVQADWTIPMDKVQGVHGVTELWPGTTLMLIW